MSKLTFETDDFRCRLKCDQCAYTKPDGRRCKNRVCIGYPVCWIHTKKEFGLRVKDSNVVDGKGLFADKRFDRHDWICPYMGEPVTQACIDVRYPQNTQAPYAVRLDIPYAMGGGDYIDAACSRGVGAIANALFTATGNPMPPQDHNAQIETRLDGLWLRARRTIRPGDEIFVHPGEDFGWDNNYVTKRMTRPDTRPC